MMACWLAPHRTRRLARAVMRFALGSAICALLIAATVPAGAYEVGYTSVVFVDPERGDRQIATEIYYPADQAGADVPVAAPPPGGFPVIACGHGYLMSWDRYVYLADGLVPNGFVLALPKTEGNLFPSHGAFGLDLAFVIAALQEANADPGSPFHQRIGAGAAVAGHSMGGGASFLAAEASDRVTAIFNLAAAETNPSAIAAAANVGVPALLFSGSVDCVTPPADHQLPMYDALASDCKTWVGVTGASHCQFALQSTVCELGEFACDDPTITRAEQHALVLALLDPWLRHTLGDEPGAWGEFQDRLELEPGIEYEQLCTPADVADGGVAGRAGDAFGAGPLHLRWSPNPTRGAAQLEFHLAAPGPARIELFSPTGRLILAQRLSAAGAGWQRFTWDGRDRRGTVWPAGAYLARVRAGGTSATRLLLRVR